MSAVQGISSMRRPDVEYKLADVTDHSALARPLPLWRRIGNSSPLRRTAVLLALALIWEAAARYADNPLMFPSLTQTLEAFWESTKTGELPARVGATLKILLLGYVMGVIIAALLAMLAVTSRLGEDILSTVTSIFMPLPAIAILPLALLWLGLGAPSLILVMLQSIVWVMALNTFSGFQSVPQTLRMVGQNVGLDRFRYIMLILVPAAFPSILTGLKMAWAFSWRTLIGAELVFGVTSRSGGLGWYIFENRSQLQTEKVFAGLLTVIVIGVLVESVIFRSIERATIRRWGMQQ